ncbi:Cytochrome P450 family protein [Beauveria brongniartii RCEF 3172]|uniref:Cytochrome P450 family protein n=1 Tax=Beauveria brongniartii RCEF 3172 TaxID=1081107 RepID=A0A166W7Z4_9HYPO|nr:Cytochrome P450 family protein [Beauveria brongniartii RCEF 3172]
MQNFPELEDLALIREKLNAYTFLSPGTASKLYSFLPTQANGLLADFTKRFREFNLRMVATAEQKNIECPLLRISQKANMESGISMEQFLHTIDEILFENIDVASAALTHLLVNVGSDAAVQDEVHLEASRYLENSEEESFQTYLGRSDTYLELCCAESRRLCPVLWYAFCERAPSDKVINGFFVPANTDVTIDLKRINIHSPIWTSQVSTKHGKQEVNGFDYCPARFSQLSKPEYRYSFLAYGGGTRKCLGQNFSNLIMRLFLLEVISNYHITVEFRPWELGFRRDKFTLTPKSQEILFEKRHGTDVIEHD